MTVTLTLTRWVSPAATLLLSGLRAAGLTPPPPPAEGAEAAEGEELPVAALTVRAALLRAEEFLEAGGSSGSSAESVPCAFTSGAEGEVVMATTTTLAWAEEEVLTLQLPAGSPRPATLRLSLHDANGEEVCAAEVRLIFLRPPYCLPTTSLPFPCHLPTIFLPSPYHLPAISHHHDHPAISGDPG